MLSPGCFGVCASVDFNITGPYSRLSLLVDSFSEGEREQTKVT